MTKTKNETPVTQTPIVTQTPVVRFEDVPPTYTPCFCSECPRSGECARYAVGQVVPPGPRIGSAVYPGSYRDTDSCPYFRQLRVIREAWGLTPLFADVKERDSHALRMAVQNYLGSHTAAFRYNHGERKLTPEQQADIFRIFARFGYDTTNLRFENYRDFVDYNE